MDIDKIGAFLTERRKEKDLTQKDIADKLCVTDRAISKWERGKGLPDASLMLPLCEVLDITVNELLSGEKIEKQDAGKRAEKQIIDLLHERQESKKRIWLSAVVSAVGIFVLAASILLSSYLLDGLTARILTITFGVVIMLVCLTVTILIDKDSGSYECPHCKKRFVPDIKTYTGSIQTFTKRKMTCPYCGKRSWCKRKLNK